MIDRGEGNFRVDRKGRQDDEKELLFFVSNEYDDQMVDEDALAFDPCHQNLLNLFDKLMLATGIFISIVLLTAVTIVVFMSGTTSSPHLLNISLKSKAPSLTLSESVFTTNITFNITSYISENPDIFIKWSSITLCNDLQRKSILSHFLGNTTHYYPNVNEKSLQRVYQDFLKIIYRNVSDIVSPLDQISHCDINNHQTTIAPIISKNISKIFPRKIGYKNDNLEYAFKLMASQYDENDAIISVGQSTERSATYDCKSTIMSSTTNQPSLIGTVKRIVPLQINNFRKSCRKLMISSSTRENFFTVSDSISMRKISVLPPEAKADSLNTRIILNTEVYDHDSNNSFNKNVSPNDVTLDVQLDMEIDTVNSTQKYSLPPIRILPGYKIDVNISSCNAQALVRESFQEVQNFTQSIKIVQQVTVNPWTLSSVDTMLVFGRVGYFVQDICKSNSPTSKKRSLEEKYPNICTKISVINFKPNGESDIANVVFESDEAKVSPGLQAIFSYIRDNIAIINLHAPSTILTSCV